MPPKCQTNIKRPHFQVDGINDKTEMDDTFNAMATMGIDDDGREDILALTAGSNQNSEKKREFMFDGLRVNWL